MRSGSQVNVMEFDSVFTDQKGCGRMSIDDEVALPRFALIYAPGRTRDRVPEQCVTVQGSESAARAAADLGKGLRAAEVLGPMRSSEGLRVYFVRRWL